MKDVLIQIQNSNFESIVRVRRVSFFFGVLKFLHFLVRERIDFIILKIKFVPEGD